MEAARLELLCPSLDGRLFGTAPVMAWIERDGNNASRRENLKGLLEADQG